MFRSMVFGVLLSVWFCAPVQAQVTGEVGKEFAVEVDKAKIMRLPRTASAVIVGNPAIADATVHDGRLLLITGKIFGGTNIIALDARGNVIVERDIQVRAPQMAAITYYRGGQQRSFTCAGTCEPTPSIGDDKDHFNTLLRQQKSKSEQGKDAALSD